MESNQKAERIFNRREIIAGATIFAAGAVVASKGYGEIASLGEPAQKSSGVPDSSAVVATTAGELQGYIHDGIYTFKGVPYGAPPTGMSRYMPPAKRAPWSGKLDALVYGPSCPQAGGFGGGGNGGGGARPNPNLASAPNPGSSPARPAASGTDQSDMFRGQSGEDCLCLNVWTPALDGRKRPVMFWLHGGGFDMGSGKQNGEHLARRGDVVVVTINHRVGVLGYLDLSTFGPEFAKSANVGSLDQVAALEWVRDNISNFGGDSGNVTIFGQSAGGGKVTALMAMPAAKGLFHKAIVMSGSMIFANMPDESALVGANVLSELGLSKVDATRIHDVPIDQLVAAGAATKKKLQPPRPFTMGRQMWGPTLDADVLPFAPFDPSVPNISASIPLMVGSTLTEFATRAPNMTEEDLHHRLYGSFGVKSNRIIEACHKLYPEAKPVEIYSIVAAYTMFRTKAVLQADRQSSERKAPVYNYQYCWGSHGKDGIVGATHASDIAFAFYDMDDRQFTTGGEEARAVAAKISDAWIAFAHKGNPNHPGLPAWPQYNGKDRPVMIFDNQCVAKNDYDRELANLLSYDISIYGR